MSLSMIDVAYQVLSEKKKSLKFSDLWHFVCVRVSIDKKEEKEKMSQFFTNLSLDNRFALINNTWDIRSRHKLEDVIIDTSPIDIEEDEEEELIIETEKGYDDPIEEEEE